ncbi:MAG: glycosyltransferase family 4 protein [Rubricoccaceae bacterium]
MRILYFYQYFSTPKGSWGTRAYEMARRWVENGDRVTVVTSVYDKSDLKPTGLVERMTVDGIDLVVINVRLSNKHGFVKRLASFVLFALMSCWYAVREPADVVVASSGPLTAALPGLAARHLRRRPFVFEIRDLLPEVPIQLGLLTNPVLVWGSRWLERAAYRASSLVVAASSGQAKGVRAVDADVPVAVITNASDNDLFGTARPEGAVPPPQGAYVLYAGTFGKANNCMQLLDAADVLLQRGRSDIHVALVGDGKEREELVASIEQRQLTNVVLQGIMPKTDLVVWMQRARAGLISLADIRVFDTSSPNKLFDALASGVPVIQTTQGWIKTLLEDAGCGINVPPDDPEALADAIELVCDNDAAFEEMGRNARNVAEQRFDRNQLAAEMRDMLAEAAGQLTQQESP